MSNLEEDLKYLQLYSICKVYQDKAKEAEEKNLSYTGYLELLIQEEVTDRIQRSIKKRITQAKFPIIKTIDTFNFDWPKSINRKKILQLFDMKFVEEKKNVLILAPPGLGKTHLAISLGYAACQRRLSTLFISAIDIVNNLYASMSDFTFTKKMRSYLRPKILIIDELGYLPLDKKGSDFLFQIIDKRYEKGSIILTSNLAFKDWGKIFGNNTTATAAIDRLVHHCEIITIQGDSYRLKDKKNKKLLQV